MNKCMHAMLTCRRRLRSLSSSRPGTSLVYTLCLCGRVYTSDGPSTPYAPEPKYLLDKEPDDPET